MCIFDVTCLLENFTKQYLPTKIHFVQISTCEIVCTFDCESSEHVYALDNTINRKT